jgi:hypothetical protein
VKPNTRLLENPYLLKDLDEDLDPFLLELTDLGPPNLVKIESMQASLTLFKGTSTSPIEGGPQMMTTMTSEATDPLEEEDLLMKTLMVTCRIMSLSPWPSKLELWDPYPGSLMEIEPKLEPSSLSS